MEPPAVVNDLRQALAEHDPRVRILAPSDGSLVPDGPWTLRLGVEDWPLVDAGPLGLGPHLVAQLDDQPPLRLTSTEAEMPALSPGSHRLTVYAARPWGEAVKSPGAYRQIRLHRVAANPLAIPAPGSPQLIAVAPPIAAQREPVLLDWLLLDAPLQNLRGGDPDGWRLRVSVNGDSFLVEEQTPLWLRGWRNGENALQLELVDGRGEPLNPPFNSLVSGVTISPGATARPWQAASLAPGERARLLGIAPPEEGQAAQEPAAPAAGAPGAGGAVPTPAPAAADQAREDPASAGTRPEAEAEASVLKPSVDAAPAPARAGATPATPSQPDASAPAAPIDAGDTSERGGPGSDRGSDQPPAPEPPSAARESASEGSPPARGATRAAAGAAADTPGQAAPAGEPLPVPAAEAPAAEAGAAQAEVAPSQAAAPPASPDSRTSTGIGRSAEPEDSTAPQAPSARINPTGAADAAPQAPPPPPPGSPAAPRAPLEAMRPAREQVNPDGTLIRPTPQGPLSRLRERLGR
ncbi:MAG: hypothetical protein VKO65_00265 [Cyanobacteriota bacterium]|nr:hypothetical protein [Cyanobacteriota bacterium]